MIHGFNTLQKTNRYTDIGDVSSERHITEISERAVDYIVPVQSRNHANWKGIRDQWSEAIVLKGCCAHISAKIGSGDPRLRR